MYKAIRYIIFFLVFSGIILVRRKKGLGTFLSTALIAGGILVCCAINLWPFENVAYSFDSPYEVFSYIYPNATSISTVMGSKSALVIAKDSNGADIYEIIPKTEFKWKLPSKSGNKEILRAFYGTTHVQIYSYSNEDYYVLVIANGVNTVGDNKDSEFYCDSRWHGDVIITSGYAYVRDISDYCLLLDGEEMVIT